MNFKAYLEGKVVEGSSMPKAVKMEKSRKPFKIEMPVDDGFEEKVKDLCETKYETKCSFKKIKNKKIMS